ncbi:MAG: MBL fold metallo-hydrolase [Candidatus Gastranaerophilales bacterium]|nr:MBL fold metallo-hydrolase [Candidatus Gastranaerophilales bacterium]
MTNQNEQDFLVKFRGTRGSYPTAKPNFLKFGGNTACIEVHCGKQLIILDAGTGIIDIGIDEIKNSIISEDKKPHQATIILSHIHQDHIQGLQFYRPLFAPSSIINLFGLNTNEESLKDTLKTILFDKVFPLGIDEIRSNFNINNLTQNDIVVVGQDGDVEIFDNLDKNINVKEDDVIISAYKTTAHPKNGCLCIKVEYKGKTLVYATDKESYIGADKKFIQFAYNCDCLIHDAQYTYQDYINPIQPKQGYGHSTFEMAIETGQLAKAKKLFFFHYDPDYDDDKLSMLESEFSRNNENVFFAKENFEVSL